jgi:hypothetical protein
MTRHVDREISSLCNARRWFVISLLLTAACGPGIAQVLRTNDEVQRGSTIGVERVRQLRKDVDLWPLIVHPNNPATRGINRTLKDLNREFADKVQDCLSGKFAGSKESFNGGEWERTVKVTMRGPRFLSMVATDGSYCGGAHPDDDLTVLVFDLETGSKVDWSTMLEASAGGSSAKNVLGNEGGTHPLMLPELQAIYSAAEEASCKDYFEEEQPFLLWPDAGSGTLIAEVAGLPHVAVPCKNELKLRIEQARKLGFDESLLQAIEAAHLITLGHSEPGPVQKQSLPTATIRSN